MQITEVIEKLRCCKNTEPAYKVKEKTYSMLYSKLTTGCIQLLDLQSHSSELLKSVCRDILLENANLVLSALQILHLILNDNSSSSPGPDVDLIFSSLVMRLKHYMSIDVTKLVFQCLAAVEFTTDCVVKEIPNLVKCMEELSDHIAQEGMPHKEIVDLFTRFETYLGESLAASSHSWSVFIFPGLSNIEETVREKSFALLDKFTATLSQSQPVAQHLAKLISGGLALSLKQTYTNNELFVIKSWMLIVKVLGKELHRGGSTINALLGIIELAFKGVPEIRSQAFVAWRYLIDNFALDKNVISDPKRIKLLMMVMKIDNSKTEDVALEKLKTWWHIIISLDAKLSVNFEQIVYPLLQFCVGSIKLQNSAAKIGQSPRLALKSPNSPATPGLASHKTSVYLIIQKLGCQVVAHLLKTTEHIAHEIDWTLAPLTHEVFVGSSSFVKHAPVIINTVKDLFLNVGSDIQESLAICIWMALADHLKSAFDSSVKTECRDVFSSFLSLLQTVVQCNIFPTSTAWRMIEACCSFPQKVLASTAFTISSGVSVRSSPALFLSEILLSQCVQESFPAQASLNHLLSLLVDAGVSNKQGALQFLQSVTSFLDTQAKLISSASLFNAWHIFAIKLQTHVSTTNEVNQGDALEYNFGCMYAVLLFPLKHDFPSKLLPADCRAFIKIWKDLYHNFARLSALVPTAEANACFEHLSAKIILLWNPLFESPVTLECLACLCLKMIDCVDFSSISLNHSLSTSPSKWARKRQKPLGSLHSFVHLLAILQSKTNVTLSKLDEGKIVEPQHIALVPSLVTSLIDIYLKLFSHITTNSIIINCLSTLAAPIAYLYQPQKTTSFNIKLEKLWQEMCNCVSSRYCGQYDSEFLEYMSPLLTNNFVHSCRSIKNQTFSFWNITFSRLSTLVYPDALKPVLAQLKERKVIILPGWIGNEETPTVIAETPFSEMNMGESQVIESEIPGMPSPKQQKRSLLSSPKLSPSPGAKASPVKVVDPKTHSFFPSACKKIAVDLLPDKDFVVISSPSTQKKRLLTEHQKEMMKEKRILPAMYNNLDASQDISLGSQFASDTQQDESTADLAVNNTSDVQEKVNTVAQKVDIPVSDTSSSVENFVAPHPVKKYQKRQTVRIKEYSPTVGETEEIRLLEAALEKKLKNDVSPSKSNPASRKCPKEIKLEPENVSQAKTSAGKKQTVEVKQEEIPKHTADSPFYMFRNKNASVDKDIGICSVSLSQDSVPKSSDKRKNSLRKVQSQDYVSEVKSHQTRSQTSEPILPNVRTPRRVTLKKIVEKENQKTSDDAHTTSNNSDQPAELDTQARACKKVDSTKEDCETSCTLVEDTQSPMKSIKEHARNPGHTIAETPTKSEDSVSPPTRSHSARKLFADVERPTPATSGDVFGSQGFTASMEEEKTEKNASTNHPESENLFPSTQESFALQMPTLGSVLPQGTPASDGSQQPEPEADPPAVLHSSSEADFLPSQPTLTTESPKNIVNKRKIKVPKKYTPFTYRKTRQRRNAMNNSDASQEAGKKLNVEKKRKLTQQVKALVTEQSPPQLVNNSQNISKNGSKVSPEKNGASHMESKSVQEVTPDVKSPVNVNANRRHSATKRSGRLAKTIERESAAKRHSSRKIESYSVVVVSESPRENEPKCAIEVEESPDGKKPRTESYHLSTTTEKCTQSKPDPTKSINLNKKRAARRRLATSTDVDTPKKKMKLMENEASSGDEDDQPLSLLQKNMSQEKENASHINKNVSTLELPVESVAGDLVGDSHVITLDSPLLTDNVIDLDIDSNDTFNDSKSQIVDKALNTALSQISASVQHALAASDIIFSTDSSATSTHQLLVPVPDTRIDATKDLATTNTASASGSELAQSNHNDHIFYHLNKPLPAERCLSFNDNIVIDIDSETDCTGQSLPHIASQSTNGLNIAPVDSSQATEVIEIDMEDDKENNESALENTACDGLTRNVDNEDCFDKEGIRPSDDVFLEPSQLKPAAALQNVENLTEMDVGVQTTPERLLEEKCLSSDEEKEDEHVLHDWSPSKSPSCSILKKATETPPSGQNRRVSFAEPVVSGESPIRVKYHSEALPTSPLIVSRDLAGKKPHLCVKSLRRVSGYRRKLDPTLKKDSMLNLSTKKSTGPVVHQLSPGSYKPTQESQLDSTHPIFPDLIGCVKPLDDILPQLTSSLWYRGLCQLMKGRNLNTIGDLSSLTEVQINQLPIRHPKVLTVRSTLAAYVSQHGLLKSNSTAECNLQPKDNSTEKMDDTEPNVETDQDTQQPIEVLLNYYYNYFVLLNYYYNCHLYLDTGTEDSSKSLPAQACPVDTSDPLALTTLMLLDPDSQSSSLKRSSTAQLLELLTQVQTLSSHVINEIKSRQTH
ncbi:telomere-associated protein RIF1-like [Physella acuta]|uniref:telomere-associated protein RIF1-like n=1 Tax=Physella acuta TaxID=109671 RepID=UPI0027DE6BF5|nr:telomere-associated protein RIF1-like [Physella acuta]